MTALGRMMTFIISVSLLALGGAAWYFYLHYSDPETVRKLLVAWANQVCPKAKIEIDSAEANLFSGVALKGCTLRALNDPSCDMITLDAITVVPDRKRLLEGKLHIKQITLTGPTLKLRQRADGTWNISELLTGRKLRFPHPTDIAIKKARVEMSFAKTDLPNIRLEDVTGSVRLRPEGTATWKLTAHHKVAKDFVVEGKADFVSEQIDLEAKTESSVELADLYDLAPRAFRDSLRDLDELRGLVDVHVKGMGKKTPEGFAWDGALQGELRHASALHARFPYPIREGEARFRAQRSGLVVSDLHFALGPARGRLALAIPEWKQERLAVEGSLVGVELSPALRKVLDERGQKFWDRFQPTGFVDIKGKLIRVGDELALAGQAELKDATLRFEKFPYPVDNVKGLLHLAADGNVTYDLTGRAGTGRVEIEGTMHAGPPPQAVTVTLRGEGVSLDEELYRALPAGPAKVVRDLNPGVTTGNFVCQVDRPAGVERFHWNIDADIKSTEATWAAFPYRVRDVMGKINVQPGRVEFTKVTGSAGNAVVQVQGSVWTETEGVHTEVGVRGLSVPLDDKLLRALPAHAQTTIERLRAAGSIDFACNAVKGPNEDLWMELEIDPAGAHMEPEAFPYRLEGFQGKFMYRNGSVEWGPMTARHGPVALKCSGSFVGSSAGGTLELRNLESNNLIYDEGMRRAAPPSLKKTLAFFSPERPVGIRFPKVLVQWEGTDKKDWRIELDGGIAVKDAKLIPSVGLTDVDGMIWYRGSCVNDSPRFTGSIDLTSAVIEGFRAENVKSSFKVDGTRVDFPNLRADMYGGQVHANIRAENGLHSAYECRVNLYGARLQDYLKTRSGNPPSADGMVYLDLFLEGDGSDMRRLKGRGKLDVLEAELDRLPMLQDLFRIGNLQPPRGRAFEEVNCDFRVEDRIVRIEKLDLLGPASIVGPSFNLFSDGEGTLDVDTWEMDLAVSARWGRGRLRVPVLTPSFNLASDQVFSFAINGRLDQPVITPAPLKGFLRMLEGESPAEYARRRRFR